MKTKLIYLICFSILLFESNTALSQTAWFEALRISSRQFDKVYFLTENIGFLVGSRANNYGSMYTTTNSGNTWEETVFPNSTAFFKSIDFRDTITGFIVGGDYLKPYIFKRTNNKGANWFDQTLPIPTDQILQDIKFCNDSIGYISGNKGLILKTTTGGNTWVQLNTFVNLNLRVLSIVKSNPDVVFAVGNSNAILRSTNGGLSWNVSYVDPSEMITNVSMINSSTGYISGNLVAFPYLSVFYKTTDGGVSWINNTHYIPIGYPMTNRWNILKFIDENTGIFAASKIYKSINGGINWQLQESYSSGTIYKDIFFKDMNKIFVTCTWQSIYNGILLTTSTGGEGPPNAPTSLSGTRRDSVSKLNWLDRSMIEEGFRIERRDLTDSIWIEIGTVSENVNTFTDSNSSGIFSYRVCAFNSLGNSSYTNEIIPILLNIENYSNTITEFSLHQNFPNPFNSTTNIKFSLPTRLYGQATQYTILKVFDALGREIATLVNESLQAGVYQYQFTTDNYQLPSGVYFYRLEAGEYVQARKMILEK